MSAKTDKKTRRIATKQAIETVNSYVANNGPLIMQRAIEAIKGLPLENRQKIAEDILRGNDA